MKHMAKSVSTIGRLASAFSFLILAIGLSGCLGRFGSREEDVTLRLTRTSPYDEAFQTAAQPPKEAGARPVSIAPANGIEEGSVYRLKTGDSIVLSIRTVTAEQFELIIDENGQIRLPLLDPIRAAGLTSTELEQVIQRAYIDQKIYRFVTAHVFVPIRSYFVRGEVRSPGRYPLTSGGVTLLQAIATAGGYTDFAAVTRIELIRGTVTTRVDARDLERFPEKDIKLESNDLIVIPRKWF
ncbi:MAG: polysaccharide biosynthesis/export family protein [Kiritimatiellia bacterium]|nr:polysaccharide biosynthesis/export family protein [Kiritimatiellia bacterium]